MSDVVVFLGSLSQAQLGDTVTLTLTNDGKVIYKQQQTPSKVEPAFYFSTKSDIITPFSIVTIEVGQATHNVSRCIFQIPTMKCVNTYIHNLGSIDCNPYHYHIYQTDDRLLLIPTTTPAKKISKVIIQDNYFGVTIFLIVLLLLVHYIMLRWKLSRLKL